MIFTPKEELIKRVNKLQEKMKANNCDGFLISQNVDLFYFSGTMQNAQLYIPIEGEPILFCRKSFERSETETPWKTINTKNFKLIPEQIKDLGIPTPECLALELDVISASSYLFLKKLFNNQELVNGSNWIKDVRSVKSPYEIEILRNAGKKTAEAFSQVDKIIKPGLSEFEIAADIENLLRQSGHQGTIRLRGFNQELFYGLFLSGESGTKTSSNDGIIAGAGLGPYFPMGPSEKKVNVNEPLFMDYVGVYDGYAVDQTRMSVIGVLPDKLYYAYRISLEIQDLVINQVKPGCLASKLYKIAVDKAEKSGLQDNFMGYGQDGVKFIGHGIGLELDEMPVIAKGFDIYLEEGMVFALEPKFVLPGSGIVGIENTWVVTKNGVEKLTVLPDRLITI
ncbi:Xaa-Pro aminopeptidase [Candidatus Syntrophocurvum alkaliphilum]|uniref:Xaa-Pro aminopeptidase n=1 Tax=Candidatus Syntrophocurvum alkaliphilum TaxID=2293317 RepID=A0A6I6DCR1_9FIRM|nr:Xaa-Pro peptidase family protein [Candidatus Syntrophocurvum alkaliphilum]QGT98920.1 Xaa-Pro aminopeptidase [Candidatus Syntrophocurvum alkaliphilum]